MHSTTKNYYADKINKRQEWFEEDNIANASVYLPENYKKVVEEIKALTDLFKNLPGDKDSYGLVHADIHGGNFFVEEYHINLFDFDDSCYHWYVYDLAVIIYSVLTTIKDIQERNLFALEFSRNLLEGYYSENNLDRKWLKYIPDIFRLRDLLIFVFLHKKWDLNNLSERDQEYFNNLKNRVENSTSLIDDFNGIII